MTKKLISISLIVALLATVVRLTIPYLWYYSNYDYIAHELCENRHNPEVECDGKCQLEKMVQKQHDHDDSQSPPPEVNEQRVHLYFAGSADLSVIPALLPNSVSDNNDQMKTIWYGATDSPPPQKA